jgi:hypothetical protein
LEIKEIEFHSQPISDTFTVSLLGKQGSPEDSYPAYDTVLLAAQFTSYEKYVKNVIMTEESRLELGIGYTSKTGRLMVEDKESSSLYSDIEEFIDVLEKGMTVEETPSEICAWIWAHVHPDMRDAKGVRVIRDSSVGKKWNSLLGTSLFPDLIIARRITLSSWNFKHALSENLILAILAWWSQAYGISETGWVSSSEVELDRLYDTFRFKEGPAYKTESEDVTSPITTALTFIEESILGNSTLYSADSILIPSSVHVWNLWIQRMFRHKKIPLNIRTDLISEKIQEWMRDKWGIRKERLPDPAILSWNELWSVLTKDGITEKSFIFWLQIMEANDPAMTVTYSKSQKEKIIYDMVPYALSIIRTNNPADRTKTGDTTSWIQTWILQFIPAAVFEMGQQCCVSRIALLLFFIFLFNHLLLKWHLHR